jgi:hypothetical protein
MIIIAGIMGHEHKSRTVLGEGNQQNGERGKEKIPGSECY